MTKEQLAEKLNGREYGAEMTKQECMTALKDKLVIVFGYSDDTTEFTGAISAEVGGGKIFIHSTRVLDEHYSDCSCRFCSYEKIKAKCAVIEAIWGKDGYSWTYETTIPHATFEIVEDGKKYCRGIVFSVSDLPTI